MNRRTFIRAAWTAGAGVLVAACSDAGSSSGAAGNAVGTTPAPTGAAEAGAAPFDPVSQVTDAEQVLSVLAATFEQIAGEQVPFAFGVRDIDNAPVADEDLSVYVVSVGAAGEEGEIQGPFAASLVDDPTGQGGLYLAELPFTDPGMSTVVAVTGDEQRAGSATVPVTTAETSAFPAPSDAAPVVATPTMAAPLAAEQICTQDPPCGMHDVSLDDALQSGRRVVLQFATPAYCQTAVCGPSVAVLDQVRQEQDWGDIAFIHCEIYADAGQTLLDPVAEWNLPSEPWMYTIGADGRIVARTDGALLTLPDQVSDMVSTL